MSDSTINQNQCGTSAGDGFRKRVEYLEAVDEGWRGVLADVDSLLKTFSSLSSQAVSGELRSLIDCGKRAQHSRRRELDDDFDNNLLLLQQGAAIEDTQPLGAGFADIDWLPYVRSALSDGSGVGFPIGTGNRMAFPGLEKPVNDSQLSKSLPNTDFLLNSLHAKALNKYSNSKLGANCDDVLSRRHSVYGAPGENRLAPCCQQTIERFVNSRSLKPSHRLISSSIDSRGSDKFCEEDANLSFGANSRDDISPSADIENDANSDWDYDAMYNKIVSRPKKTLYPNHNMMRRQSSPPYIPANAFTSSETVPRPVPNQRMEHHQFSTSHGSTPSMVRRIMLRNPDQHVFSPAAQAIIEKNNINPKGEFNLDTKDARYIVIKSFTEESIFSALRYSVWCSTFRGNQRLDKVYRSTAPAPVYLFFSVNNTGNFCGVAQMTSPVDFERYAGCWTTPRWKGAFAVKWIYVKDVPFRDFRDIVLPEDGRPVCKSRDTQEVLPGNQGVKMLRIFHERKMYSSIFNEFDAYDERFQRQNGTCNTGVVDFCSSSLTNLNVAKAGGDLDFTDD